MPKMPIPNISPKQWRSIKRTLGAAGTAAWKLATSEAGTKVAGQAARKGLKILRKKGANAAGLKLALGSFRENLVAGAIKVGTTVATKTPEVKHAEAVLKFKKRFGSNMNKWGPNAKKAWREQGLHSVGAWMERNIENVDYARTPEQLQRRHRFVSRLSKGVLGVSVPSVIMAYGSDKAKAEGFVETPGGHRFEPSFHAMSLKNIEGRGARVDAGFRYRGPTGTMGELGGSAGFGHARKAGFAHQAIVRARVHSPYVKTGWELGEQHAFGTKSRSRRVSAIRRAVFGSEQHLGVLPPKPGKKQRRADML